MKRIAYCSPVNPLPSGISDYSEELLPYLGQYAEVGLFTPDGTQPTNTDLPRHLEVRPIHDLSRLHGARPFDAIVYHMGNSPAHAEIYEHALRIPGVVVLHEWVLHHFKLWYAATRRGDVGRYQHELAARYGARGEATGRRMAQGALLDAAFEMPLVEDIVDQAAGVIGHSRLVVERAVSLRPDLAAAVVPMGVPLPALVDTRDARQMLGLPEEIPIWASFGHINPYKRMEPALRAFRRFLRREPDARYILVGSVSPSYDLRSLIRRLDLDAAVQVTGYVPPAEFNAYVAASDVCLNLRYPTAGETSASLLRLLGAGKATLVSSVGAFRELPDDVCCKVEPGPSEADLILAYIRLLHELPPLRNQLSRNARRYVAEEHSLERAARGYINFLARLGGWGVTEPFRPPLWEVAPVELASAGGASPAQPEPRLSKAGGDQVAPVPLAILDPLNAPGQLARDAGVALGELGVAPDSAVAEDVAGAIASMFGAGPSSR
jgi:glycosyltransferase involved in cell wall biosynthesis